MIPTPHDVLEALGKPQKTVTEVFGERGPRTVDLQAERERALAAAAESCQEAALEADRQARFAKRAERAQVKVDTFLRYPSKKKLRTAKAALFWSGEVSGALFF